jgi:hypothetical protein
VRDTIVVVTDELKFVRAVEADELNPVVVVAMDDDNDATDELRLRRDELTFNRLELIGIIELLFVFTTPVRDTIVVVTDELKFVRAVEADELNPVVVVETEDDKDATDPLNDNSEDETNRRLELTGITELLLVDINDVRETTVVVNDVEIAVSVADNELEYVCAFIANEAVPKNEPVICEPLIIEAVI